MRRKTRLTITLSPDLVGQLDRLIDGRTVRSRSHAIETLLRRSLDPSVETAVLLAGGKRKRVGIPALAPIGGRPLVRLTVEHLVHHGIRTFLVLAGGNEARIRSLLGDGASLGARIRYVAEEKPLGTAGALKKAEPLLVDGPFLVLNADVLTDIDIGSLIDFHVRENATATIAVKPRQAEESYGKALLEGNRIRDFIPKTHEQGISIVNAGVYLLRPEVLGLIEEDKASRLETDVFPRLARMGELAAFFFQGIWFDVTTPEERRLAELRWNEKGGRHRVRR